MIELVNNLIVSLREHKVQYCHWKSNRNLEEVYAAETDIDILIHRESVDTFHACISELGFKQAIQHPGRDDALSIRHFYGLDHESGKIVHIHAHYRIVTAGSVLKNHHLPAEMMLFDSVDYSGTIPVPGKAVELLLLVVRKIIEYGSPVEAIMVMRERISYQEELEWLLEEEGVLDGDGGTLQLLNLWLPTVPNELFIESLNALRTNASLFTLFSLSMRMNMLLSQHLIYPVPVSGLMRCERFFRRVVNRYLLHNRTHRMTTGGNLIAIVGPEATGKSTFVNELTTWLGNDFSLLNIHAGKPPPSLFTWIPNKLLPTLRRSLPSFRTGSIEEEIQGQEKPELEGMRLLLFILRSIMLAYDRRRLLIKASRKASQGVIVICDRYPTPDRGAMDSVQVDPEISGIRNSRFLASLASFESWLYQSIPQPDLILQLTVDVEVAVKRNAVRIKADPEDEAYVRRRHAQSKKLCYNRSLVCLIDTDEEIPASIKRAKEFIWSHL